MVVSFKDIISKGAFDILKLAYQDFKLGSVLRIFLQENRFFFLPESQFSFNMMLEIRLRFD